MAKLGHLRRHVGEDADRPQAGFVAMRFAGRLQTVDAIRPPLRQEPPAPTAEPPGPRPGPGRVVGVGLSTWAAPAPEQAPDAARWTGWLAVALGEALLGRRPATQLAGWVSREVLAGLARRQRLRPAEDTAPRTVLPVVNVE